MAIPNEFVPFRLRVLMALSDELRQITPENGYYHDLSNVEHDDGAVTPRVVRGRSEFGDNDPVPLLAVLEHPQPGDPDVGIDRVTTTAQNEFLLLLQGSVKGSPDHPTDEAHVFAAEVVKRLSEVDRQGRLHRNVLGLGDSSPCVVRVTVGNPVVRPPTKDVSVHAFFYVPVSIDIVEDRENPFTQP